MDTLNSEGMSFKRPQQNSSKDRVSKHPCDKAYEEPFVTIPRRRQLHEENLKILSKHQIAVDRKYNNDLGEKLLKFVKNAVPLVNRGDYTLPIGILESGLTDRENDAMFDFVQTKLLTFQDDRHEKMNVARIQPGTSSSTKAIFQKICGQIIEQRLATNKEDADIPNQKGAHFSLCDVRSFLESGGIKRKLFVLVESVEYFAQSVISQLLMLLGCADFPVLFIFGTTHGHYIDHLIPVNCSAEFVVEKFYSVSATSRLNDFMKRVLFDSSNPFRISGAVAAYLYNFYKEDNFSIQSISDCLKLCSRFHFFSAMSAFCSLEKSSQYTTEETQILKELLTRELNENENASPPKRRKLDGNFIKNPRDLLDAGVTSVQNWLFISKLIQFINARLHEHPLGQSFISVYVACCNGYSVTSSGEERGFDNFFRSLSSISKSDLADLLEDSVAFLKESRDFLELDLLQEVSMYLGKIEQQLVEAEATISAAKTQEPERTLPIIKLTRGHKTLWELKNEILEIKNKNDGTSPFHTVRSKLVDYLKEHLEKFSLSTLQLSKAYIFSDLNLLINAMFPANFLQLNEDLTNPGYNLQCSCCLKLSADTIQESLPDASIIHKLIAENTTKKVDLNFVYEAFVTIVQDGRKRQDVKFSLSDVTTNSYLVRFRKAVGELQHMGFIKRTKSKPDEIVRLAWW